MFCDQWGLTKGGIESFNNDICRAWGELGHQVTVRVGHAVAATDPAPGVTLIPPRNPDPETSEYFQLESDWDDLPPDVDVVVGHLHQSSLAAMKAVATRYPGAVLTTLIHERSAARNRVRGTVELGRTLTAGVMAVCRQADVVAGLGPVLAGEGSELADRSGRARAPIVQQLTPGARIIEQPELPAAGRPHRIVLFGRVGDPLKGATEAAEMARRLTAQGVNVELVALGAEPDTVTAAQLELAALAGCSVQVLPRTDDRAVIEEVVRSASVVVVPSRVEGFSLCGIEAMALGIPVLVPGGSGVGTYLADGTRFPADASAGSFVPQAFEDPVDVTAWTAALAAILRDLPAAWARARHIQHRLRGCSWRATALDTTRIFHAALDIKSQPAPDLPLPPTGIQVRLADTRVVATGAPTNSEDDLFRAVIAAMDSDPDIREAIFQSAPVDLVVKKF